MDTFSPGKLGCQNINDFVPDAYPDMGGDGQALLNSRKLLEGLYTQGSSVSADDSVVRRVNRVARLQNCQLSHKPLVAGDKVSVCCDLGGHLYLYEAVLNYLIDKKRREEMKESDNTPAATASTKNHHAFEVSRFIAKLKDVHCLDLSAPPKEGVSDGQLSLTCPITGVDAAAGHTFLCNITCGHCVAAAAVGKSRIDWDQVLRCPHPRCARERLESFSNESTSDGATAKKERDAVWVQLLLEDEAEAVSQAELLASRLKKRPRPA